MLISGLSLTARAEERSGEQIYAKMCASCHGDKGLPAANYIPVIAGQNEGYLYVELRDYKLGNRRNPIMQAIAAGLDRQDLQDLSAWYASQSWPGLKQAAPPPDVTKRAETAINAAVCQSCHLANWQGASTTPRVGGQSLIYLRSTMAAFRDGHRTNNPWMSALLKTYSDDDIDALARYLAAQ